MALRESDYRKAARNFFRQETKNLEEATRSAINAAGEGLARDSKAELRRQFKRGQGNSGFFKAVKVYKFPPQGDRGPAAYVRYRIPFVAAFQEGDTAENVLIRLPEAERRGFPRATKRRNPLAKLIQRYNLRPALVSDGVIFLHQIASGEWVPVYKFQRQVRIPKKLTFYERAAAVESEIPNLISRLLEQG